MTKTIWWIFWGGLLLPLLGHAQNQEFQSRWGLQFDKEFRKGFDLSLSYQARFDHDSQNFQGSYFSISPSYKINKWLSAAMEFRYATSPVWDKFRLGAGFTAKKNFHKNQVALRLLYQYEFYYQSIPEIGQNPNKNMFRLRLQYTRKLSKDLKVYVSTEPRFLVREQIGWIQRVRNSVGLEWAFIKQHSLDLSYFYQPQFSPAISLDNTVHVLNLNYVFSWSKMKKKKKEGDQKNKVEKTEDLNEKNPTE